MTEREGGSDVGATATRAVRDGDVWRLYGTKWFTSAVTCDVALALARPEGAASGSRGLALFYVELHGVDLLFASGTAVASEHRPAGLEWIELDRDFLGAALGLRVEPGLVRHLVFQ